MTDDKALVISNDPAKALQALSKAVDAYLVNPSPDTHAQLRYAQCQSEIALFFLTQPTTNKPTKG